MATRSPRVLDAVEQKHQNRGLLESTIKGKPQFLV
jgi:hypothetical protein